MSHPSLVAIRDEWLARHTEQPLAPDIPIVDAHHHIWEWQNYPWLVAPITPKMYGSDYQPLRQDYLVDDLLADFGDNNVVKSVHVQANYDPSNPVGETKWLQEQAEGGQILLSQVTYEMAHQEVKAEPLDPIHVIGRREPIPAYLIQVAGA